MAWQVDMAGDQIYDKLAKIRLPRQGYNNVLPKYRFGYRRGNLQGIHQGAMESAYGRAMEQSRSQYTLVYNSTATVSTSYRKIEVRVSGYGSSLKVYARDGYYPAPQK